MVNPQLSTESKEMFDLINGKLFGIIPMGAVTASSIAKDNGYTFDRFENGDQVDNVIVNTDAISVSDFSAILHRLTADFEPFVESGNLFGIFSYGKLTETSSMLKLQDRYYFFSGPVYIENAGDIGTIDIKEAGWYRLDSGIPALKLSDGLYYMNPSEGTASDVTEDLDIINGTVFVKVSSTGGGGGGDKPVLYSISTEIIDGSAEGDTNIESNSSASVMIIPDANHELPHTEKDINVSGVDY